MSGQSHGFIFLFLRLYDLVDAQETKALKKIKRKNNFKDLLLKNIRLKHAVLRENLKREKYTIYYCFTGTYRLKSFYYQI